MEVEDEVVLGRTDQEFLQHDNEVSRRHAAVRLAPTGLEIEDLGSSSGTFVNETRIQRVTTLSSGDLVRLGQTTLEVAIEAVATGVRPGIVTAAGIVLLVGGLAGAAYGIYALVLTLRDFDLASQVGLGAAFSLIMVFAGVLVVAGALDVVGGYRTLALSQGGRILGFIGSTLVIVAWIGILGVLFANGVSPDGIGWLALGVSAPLAVASVAMLGASGRYFTA
jgi:hypothetical protein